MIKKRMFQMNQDGGTGMGGGNAFANMFSGDGAPNNNLGNQQQQQNNNMGNQQHSGIIEGTVVGTVVGNVAGNVGAGAVANAHKHIDLRNLVGDMGTMAGVVVGEIGMKVSKVPIEKFVPTTSKIERISFISQTAIAVRYHYVDNLGSFLCFEGDCCKRYGLPQLKYVFPVVLYDTNRDGSIISDKLEIRAFAVGDDMYKTINTNNMATQAYGGIDNVDLLVTCTDDKFKKSTLTQAGPAAWKSNPKVVEFIVNKLTKDFQYMYLAIGRHVDAVTFQSMLNELSTNNNAAQQMGNAPNFQGNAANADFTSYFNK